MASVICNTPYLSHSASISPTIVTKSPIFASLSTSQISCSRTLTIQFGSTPLSNWNGLRKNGFSISLRSYKLEKKRKCKEKSGVFASLFGVGAPEALVIGVVALLVFGPKGLADVAKNLGKTLRAFQPTIRELQEVSREFKSTLEKEIGLDEFNNPVQGNYTSNTVKSPSTQVPPELTVTPPPATTTEDSQATTTAPGGRPEVSRETATTPGGSPDDTPETTVIPPLSNEDSQSTVDNTNGKKIYSSEELLKITEQLKAVASQQQKDQPPSGTPESET